MSRSQVQVLVTARFFGFFMSLFIRNLSFSYGNHLIFKDVNFATYLGKVCVLIGSSGVGKTTFFKLISGLLSPNFGDILLKNENNEDVALKDNFVYMQQNDLLLPWRTVFQNLLLSFELNRIHLDKLSYLRKIDDVLEKMCLLDYKFAFPHELSGGMRQRISLARAILQDKLLFLLDEPFSSLDVAIKESLYDEIKKFVSINRKILILVTHDFRDIFSLADYVFVIINNSVMKIDIEKPICFLSNEQKFCLEEKIKNYLKMTKIDNM